VIGFRIDSGSGVSTYMQIVQQVRRALRTGLLVVGDQLPTVKDVVAKIAINPNTVLKAYRELEREGLVDSRPGSGTFVIRPLGTVPPDRQRALRRSLEKWVESAAAAGMDAEDIRALIGVTLDGAMREVA
jgi:GntR family transcriptional regulator